MIKRFLLVAAALALAAPAWAYRQTPSPAAAQIVAPCDILQSGCLSAWSVTQRMVGGFKNSLFQIYRDDAQTFTIGTLPSGYVDLPTLHQQCDGHDCYFQTLYDQFGLNTLCGAVGKQPILGWDTNGLPMVVMTFGPRRSPGYGGFMSSCSASVGLPTTGSRTMYLATSNYDWKSVSELFGYAAMIPSNDGSGFVATVTQTDPNTQTPIFGLSLEEWHYAYGAYPPGYAQLIGMIKYNAATGLMSAAVLPSSCIPGAVTGCNAVQTFQGTPPGYYPGYNTGENNPNIIRLGQGTDGFAYGGRFQSALLTNYAATPAEDSAVVNAMALTHFAQKPTKCAFSTSTLTAGKQGTAPIETPTSYVGTVPINSASSVFVVGTRLFNPNWNGPLFRVQRGDNGNSYDIYPAGCEADALATSNDCSGTTCYVTHWWDQSGHGWNFKPPSSALRPTLSTTGMNGQPCVQFSPTTTPANASFTASVDASGLMTVSAVSSGTLSVGERVTGAGLGTPTVIAPGGTNSGGVGTYQISPATGTVIASESMSGTTALQMLTDPNVWTQLAGGSTVGLYKNMTIEAIWQAPADGGSRFGPLVAMPQGYAFNINQEPRMVYISAAGGTHLTAASTVVANQAHFSYLTADASSPQNLTMKSDAAAADTTTITSAGPGTNGNFYQLGWASFGSTAPYSSACMSMAAVYNDVESSANLTAMYNLAHAVYATP